MGNAKIARRKRRLRKLRRIGLSVIGIVFIGWIFYLGATWGPRPVDESVRPRVEPGNRELVEESINLARQFEAIAAYRNPTEEELDLLRQALDSQRQYNLSTRPEASDRRRQEELEQRLSYFLGKRIHERSLEAEVEGERLLAEGEISSAMERMQEAFELQRQVNLSHGRSGFRDAIRESRLQQTVASMETAPLHQRVLELKTEADLAIEEFRWEDARKFLTEATELQTRINEASRRSVYHNPERIRRLGEKLASLRVGEMMSEVQELTETGKTHENARQWERAAQAYERAMMLQNQINRDHPQSPFVSREGAAELDVARQTALSAPQGEQFKTAVAELRGALADGNFERVGPSVENARRLADQISARFPRSSYVDADIRLELEFLSMATPGLPEMRDLLLEGLLPVPGSSGHRMSAGPVTQHLYRRVMNANPSRNLGERLPVDSITLRQAREFCRRASWILGLPVQLPGKTHFEAALGEWDPESYAALSWHSENSGGSSHPVDTGSPNPHGFLHLVGNLRIWLDNPGDNGSAWTAGASYAESIPEVDLFQQISDNQRAPTVGLRYVVAGEGS